jgi:AraC-like DNA-binding protein
MRSGEGESFRTIPTASGGIARLACTRMREEGKDVSAVLSRAGLTLGQVDDPTARIPVPNQIKLLELAAEELQDEFLGFHLARSFDLREIGLVYYIMASSEQLADACRKAERYSGVVNEGVRLHFSLDRTASIALEYVNVDRRTDRHQIEFWLVTLIRICRQVTATRLAPRQLKLRHLRDGKPSEIEAFFGSEVKFDADADQIVFSAPTASLPVVGRDTYLNRLLQQYAEEAAASRPGPRASVRSEVERIIPELLPHGTAGAAEVARQLGMSSRTLSRKLREQGAPYAEVLEQLRVILAKRYLGDRELPVSEIAWLLGYCEVSSFTHAFKGWTGMTPTQFRSAEAAGIDK